MLITVNRLFRSSAKSLTCIYLRATQEKMASQLASMTSEEIIQIIFCGVYYLTVLEYTKTTIHFTVSG